MSRIEKTLNALKANGRKGLIPFITAGYPTIEQTVPIMHALVEGGADIIEFGMPFSDPMADGPIIQHSSEVALKNGMKLKKVLEQVAEFRQKDDSTPIVLMGYANPIENMGQQAFAEAAAKAGADAVLVVDYPPEESEEFSTMLREQGMDQIFLLAPTSVDERIQHVARIGGGFIYYVSLKGVTGAANIDVAEVRQRINRIKAFVPFPVAVGFGVRDAATARRLSQAADAVVMGTRIIQEMDSVQPAEAPAAVAAFLKPIRKALDE
ncbi:MAG: tryptophan synthase subunit alpha [Oxalobacter sp.]|nr:tryptophan synthase subunit alpha [Oxalobacter sp.]